MKWSFLIFLPFALGDLFVVFPNNTTKRLQTYPVVLSESLPKKGLLGRAVLANPIDACSPVAPPPYGYKPSKWFLIIQRYPCYFDVKIRNAELAGYDAAVIFAEEDFIFFPSFKLSSQYASQNDFPAILVSRAIGDSIIENYLYESGAQLLLTPNTYDSTSFLLLPFSLIVIIVFILMLLFMLGKTVMDYRRRSRNLQSIRKQLKKIPLIKFKKGDRYEICAICLENYQEGQKLRILPCSHSYHSICIDSWLTQNHPCPICKRRAVVDPISSEGSSTDESSPLLLPSSRTRQGHPRRFVQTLRNLWQRHLFSSPPSSAPYRNRSAPPISSSTSPGTTQTI